MYTLDLSHPDCDPPDCPAWAKETIPESMLPYRGRNGLPPVYRQYFRPIGLPVRGLDRYHANQFINYRPETARFLYEEYTPLEVHYTKGLLPTLEVLAAETAAGARTAREKVERFLSGAIPKIAHPVFPPCGADVGGDRNLDDEALLASGTGWCNEQARILIRLCQISGIPARIIQIFYSDNVSGHCIAEFYDGERWCMVCATRPAVFPDASGRLLSAAECHDSEEGRLAFGKANYQRVCDLLAKPDAELRFRSEDERKKWRETREKTNSVAFWAAKLYCFGIINYPLPVEPAAAGKL